MKRDSLFLIVVIVALVAAAVGLPHSGAYFSDVQTTTCTVQTGVWHAGTPKPSLSLDPDDAEATACNSTDPVSHVIYVSNTGDEPKDVALNVTLNVTAVKGTQYVASVVYDSTVGDIPAGEAREFFLEIELNGGWESAEEGEEVKLRIQATGEDNRPEHNIGRRAHFTIIKQCSPPADEALCPAD